MRRFKRRSWRRARRAALFGLIYGATAFVVAVVLDVIGAPWHFAADLVTALVVVAPWAYYMGGTYEPAREVLHLHVDNGSNVPSIVEAVADGSVRLGVALLEVHVHEPPAYEPRTVDLEVRPGTIAPGANLAELVTPSGDRVRIKSAAA